MRWFNMFAKPSPPTECLPSTSSSWISSFLGIVTSQPQPSTATTLSLTLSLSILIRLSIFVLTVGTLFGIWICRRYNNFRAQDVHLWGADDETEAVDATADRGNNQSNNNCNNNQVNNTEEDGPTMVLRGSLDLLASKWGVDRGTNSSSLIHNREGDENENDDAVVRYLSPEQMTNRLFAKPTNDNVADTLRLDELLPSSRNNNEFPPSPELLEVLLNTLQQSPKSSATDITSLISSDEGSESSDHEETVVGTTTTTGKSIIAAPSTSSFTSATNNSSSLSSPSSQPHQPQQQISPQQFTHLLSLIQKYSVNTSHPYFFNQLFGSLDPIALAAEIVALSVNTSVYTYETAPVFTLLEREVMGQIGKLVFGNDEEQKGDGTGGDFIGEGLMIPGGSLANLTAMHAARHRWKVVNGYTKQQQQQKQHNEYREWLDDINETASSSSSSEEEKKVDDTSLNKHINAILSPPSVKQQQHLYITNNSANEPEYDLVAFVSSEAHYSFAKSARVLGLREDDLIVIPTNADGSMNVEALSKSFDELEYELEQIVKEEDRTVVRNNDEKRVKRRRRRRVPFFVACTAGSTVRGSFDDIAKIVEICRGYESRQQPNCSQQQYERSIWVHVDGAWGGSAIFSSRSEIRSITHMDEIRHADSFTFNPHKMLGAPQQTTAFIVRHRNALREANAAGAKYLFDPRKNGAEYDLGDLSYTCGRRTDAVKLWAMWKYYGRSGLGSRVDQKVDELECFVSEVRKRRNTFALACRPWPFNVNFFYFPPRIREVLEQRGMLRPVFDDGDDTDGDD
eukprot:scaffold15038_cov149-Skeletonema_menzelii.AAC.1